MRVPKIHLWNRGTARKPNYWVRYSAGGKEHREPTRGRTQAEAHAFVLGLERSFRLDTWTAPSSRAIGGVQVFSSYAETVIAHRLARGVKSAAKDEPAHLKRHLNPIFGHLRVDDLTLRGIADGFAALADKGLSGSTIRNVHVTMRAVLRKAAADGLIAFLPPPLTVLDGQLPPVTDTRPEGWRDEAQFTRDEIAALLSCDDVERQYRVMYACYFLTASRFGELVTVRVRDYDRKLKPLAALTIRALKTKRERGQMFRVVPVHPELRVWLDWWLGEGYEVIHGKQPEAGDLLFPTMSKRRQNAAELAGEDLTKTACSHGEVYKRWARHHLPAAGLRHRRLHDARRTFISLVRSSGKSKDIVRSITHRGTKDKVLDAYTTWEWEALCIELARVKWDLPSPPGREPGVVVLNDRREAR